MVKTPKTGSIPRGGGEVIDAGSWYSIGGAVQVIMAQTVICPKVDDFQMRFRYNEGKNGNDFDGP